MSSGTTGVAHVNGSPQGTAPQGTAPQGTAPQGTAPQGILLKGTTPPGATPDDIHFHDRVLSRGRPAEVGLRADQVDRLYTVATEYLSGTPDHPGCPSYAGATVLAARDGVVVSRFAVGRAVRYASVGHAPDRVPVELHAADQIPASPDTIYDVASLTKLFTSVLVLQLAEAGRVGLDTPVARYVPEFADGGKAAVTLRHLLTHTSGLPAFHPFHREHPTPVTQLAAALACPVDTGTVPGAQYVYSDIGLIILGELVQRVTGVRLDRAVRGGITRPLSMVDTGFNPDPALLHRIAATEYQPELGRGMVHGEVHDENSWGFGGISGHAGLFSAVDDLAIFCQMLLNGGSYRGRRILREETVRAALVNYNATLPDDHPDSARGLGFDLDKHRYMDGLASPVTFGHTGFTGTDLVVDPLRHCFLVVLSNNVHPTRDWGNATPARASLSRCLAEADPVHPTHDGPAWRAERRDGGTVTLTAPLNTPASSAAVATFLIWYDTEPRTASVSVRYAADRVTGPLPLTLTSTAGRFTTTGSLSGYAGRIWWYATAPLPAGTTALRWCCTTDAGAQGRGVYVDQVLVRDDARVLFSGNAFEAEGWSPSFT